MTIAVTMFVCAATFGAAYLAWLYRVFAIASSRDELPSTHSHECLIVPGKRLVQNRPDRDFQLRLRRALELAADPHAGPILILGGKTSGASISEAEAGRDYLVSLMAGEQRQILLEADSCNTLTNLLNARELLGYPRRNGPRMTLVSNRYHLARLGLIAGGLGIHHRLVPSEPRLVLNSSTLNQLAREAFFCLWFRVGTGWARLTRNQRMLGRIT